MLENFWLNPLAGLWTPENDKTTRLSVEKGGDSLAKGMEYCENMNSTVAMLPNTTPAFKYLDTTVEPCPIQKRRSIFSKFYKKAEAIDPVSRTSGQPIAESNSNSTNGSISVDSKMSKQKLPHLELLKAQNGDPFLSENESRRNSVQEKVMTKLALSHKPFFPGRSSSDELLLTSSGRSSISSNSSNATSMQSGITSSICHDIVQDFYGNTRNIKPPEPTNVQEANSIQSDDSFKSQDKLDRKQRRRIAAQIPPSFPFYEPTIPEGKPLVSILRRPTLGARRYPINRSGSVNDGSCDDSESSLDGSKCSLTLAKSTSSDSLKGRLSHEHRQNSLTKFKARPASPPLASRRKGLTTRKLDVKTQTHADLEWAPSTAPPVSLFKRPDPIILPGHVIGQAIPHPRHGPRWLDEYDNHNAIKKDRRNSTGTSSSESKSVKFDPRILVMEYLEEEAIPSEIGQDLVRNDHIHDAGMSCDSPTVDSKWFSAEELNAFKMEVIKQAQLMLLSAPKTRSPQIGVSPLQNRSSSEPSLSNMANKSPGGGAGGLIRSSMKGPQYVGSQWTPPSNAPPRMSPRMSPRSCGSKALFSNPMLKCTSEEFVLWDGTNELRDFMRKHVQGFLVVDPNKTLHVLFQKAIHPMFPDTKVTCASSAEEALKLMEAAKLMQENTTTSSSGNASVTHSAARTISDCRSGSGLSNNGFDIIIIEERLCRPWRRRDSMDDDADIRFDPSEDTSSQPSAQSAGEDQAQVSSKILPIPNMTGSELIKFLTKEEKKWLRLREYEDMGLKKCNETKIPDNFWPSLYIGISAFLAEDGPKLLHAGADLMWGKPPPRIDNNLRNELLISLLKKRGKSILIFE